MAIVLIESFDHLTAAEMTAKGWSSAPTSMTSGRFVGQAAQITNNTLRTKSLPSTYSTIIVGLAFNSSALSSLTGTWFVIRASTTNTLILTTDNGPHLQVKNSSGTVIATGTTVLNVNTWYYVEVKLVIAGASGSVEVHLNGATEISSTTGNFGSTNVDNIGIAGPNIGSSNTQWDDVYAADTTGSSPWNTFLGDVRVETINPNGDGTHTQWTPNSGSTHYTQVDEAQADGDTTYVSDATPGHIDTYTFADIDTGATVYAVQTNLYARKDDANTRQIAPVIRQSGSDNVGTTVTLASSYAVYSQIYQQDPTSTNWTPTTVNADEFGVKEIA